MTFKIATWNVNSLRVRLPHVLTWLNDAKPHVLALQELKIPDIDFPFDTLQEAGYKAIVSGQKTYNGVAILVNQELSDAVQADIITDIPGFTDHQRRVLAVTINDVRILNLYVPNGESVISDKYQYKLNWLKHLNAFLQTELKTHHKMIVLGDFNIAPETIDVHDPQIWENQVLFSLPERQAFKDILQIGFADCYRQLAPTEKNYTWWDYRLYAFKRNMGLRIDHILASEALSATCVKCAIDKAPRMWERPSDHAVVMAEFK